MKRQLFISVCALLVWMMTACGVAKAERNRIGLSLTKNRHAAPHLSRRRHAGTGYSPAKFQPRRFTPQRNLGKHIGFKNAPKPKRGTRPRTRLMVKGADALRRAANRSETNKRRREPRTERNRTVRSGFGTRN